MILTARARSLVHWCDGQQSKIRMQDSRVMMSGTKIGDGGQMEYEKQVEQAHIEVAKS
jgi:hypothetical protein